MDSSEKKTPFRRLDQPFMSCGTKCGAWLYLPEDVPEPPVVVMAHGFGAQRWMRLPAYAEHFARCGMAVFLFDYRGFNDSEGAPRHYINPSRHVEDWAAAVAYVRTLKPVNGRRMALWGTSFSAGHVMVTASREPGISAIVLQVPFTDGVATARNYPLLFQCRCVYHGLRDLFTGLFTRRRHHVKITSTPDGDFGMLNSPDAMPGMLRLIGNIDEAQYRKHNFCPANIALSLIFYRPVRHAEKISCPALVIGAEKESLFPPDGPRKAAEKMAQATYISLPMTHFEPYVDDLFDTLVVKMAEFLLTHLT